MNMFSRLLQEIYPSQTDRTSAAQTASSAEMTLKVIIVSLPLSVD